MMRRKGKRFWERTGESETQLRLIQDKFATFLLLLDNNNYVLEIMSDMEEKAQGDYLFDINYIRNSLDQIHKGIDVIIESIITLGGEDYRALENRFNEIREVLDTVLPGRQPIQEDFYVVPLERLNRTRARSVGGKNAQLGEMKSTLNLPVPEGFAITAQAYKDFVEANNLQDRISRRLDGVDIKSYDELKKISREITDMILASPIPEKIEADIREGHRRLIARSKSDQFSMRSSAIGEDTLFSFAGQYASYLNVTGDELLDRYREILASKFTPKAIYYFLSHSLSEAEYAMSVGCLSMVQAVASGVVYTRDPVYPEDDVVLVNSIYGLGKYLVNGVITPDVFRVNRSTGEIEEASIARKPVRLVIRPEKGTAEEKVPKKLQGQPSLTNGQLKQLVDYALKLEDHYLGPQDIEWAIDKNGQIYLLQSRPLQVIKARSFDRLPDMDGAKLIFKGGTTVCPGAGSGAVQHVRSHRDLGDVQPGRVLVAPNPFPGLITVMNKISALVTRVGGLASHMATIAREYRVPTLVGVKDALKLPDGQTVTVDATGGRIYEGNLPQLIEARLPEYDHPDASGIFQVLERVLDLISPLRLLHPSDSDFTPKHCMTYHDITRFAHQKAMDEMFHSARDLEQNEGLGCKLKSDIPLDVNVIFIDRESAGLNRKKYISEDEIVSDPLKYFWEGIKSEGWPRRPQPGLMVRKMGTDLTDLDRQEYSESSYAVLSKEYMILSMRMGYHFTTIEAMCTEEPSKNYIQMQYKDGGASLDRRIRRIKLLNQILSLLGFLHERRNDFLNSHIAYQDRASMAEKLAILGRLTMMTKQLDMALSTDAVANWYTSDFIRKLKLNEMTGEYKIKDRGEL